MKKCVMTRREAQLMWTCVRSARVIPQKPLAAYYRPRAVERFRAFFSSLIPHVDPARALPDLSDPTITFFIYGP